MNTAALLESAFPPWPRLPGADQARLAQASQMKKVEKGVLLHRGREDCAGLFIVGAGQLRAYIVSDAGKEITLYRLFPGECCIFGAGCIMENIQFDIFVETEKNSTLLLIPSETYKAISKTSLPVSEYTSSLLASRLSGMIWVIEQVLFTSFHKRLAVFLAEQARIENSMDLTLTHEEIAKHLGSAREVVTRMLKYFSEEGLVRLSRGTIHITNRARLAEMAS